MSASGSYDADIDPVNQFMRGTAPNVEFYDRVVATKDEGTRTLVYEERLEKHTGDAYYVPAGNVIRFEQRPHQHNGRLQIADLLFVTPDLEQYGCHLSTTGVEGFNPELYGAIWTQSKYFKKIATLVFDDFPYEEVVDDVYGLKVPHMWFAAHCSKELNMIAYGNDAMPMNSCHENFVQAVNRLPAIHAIDDPAERRRMVQQLSDHNDLNVFQPTQIGPNERGVTRAKNFLSPEVHDGMAIEFYAERDLYVISSNCPYGDQSIPFAEADPNPIYVSVWDTGIAPESDDHLGLVPGDDWEQWIYDRFEDGTLDISPRTPESFGITS